MKWALLIIDLQKAYQNRHNKDAMHDVSEYINAVIFKMAYAATKSKTPNS